jgi:hypothetical protein
MITIRSKVKNLLRKEQKLNLRFIELIIYLFNELFFKSIWFIK